MLDLTPQFAAVFGARREPLRANRILLDYLGFTNEEWLQCSDRNYIHPDDRERVNDGFDRAVSTDSAFEVEARLRNMMEVIDGFWLVITHCATTRDRLLAGIVLALTLKSARRPKRDSGTRISPYEEEISKASMFEEIVGDSPALRAVLSRVSKVAPASSTVLVTGETRNGQRTHRSGNSPPLATQFASLCECELCCHSPRFDRLGIVRP